MWGAADQSDFGSNPEILPKEAFAGLAKAAVQIMAGNFGGGGGSGVPARLHFCQHSYNTECEVSHGLQLTTSGLN